MEIILLSLTPVAILLNIEEKAIKLKILQYSNIARAVREKAPSSYRYIEVRTCPYYHKKIIKLCLSLEIRNNTFSP